MPDKSMYGKYIHERLGDEIIETEEGFATYRYLDGKTVYIIDIFVLPEFRYQKVMTGLADAVVRIAREKGCTKLIGTVSFRAKNSTASLRALLGYGMVLDSAAGELILFRKEI